MKLFPVLVRPGWSGVPQQMSFVIGTSENASKTKSITMTPSMVPSAGRLPYVVLISDITHCDHVRNRDIPYRYGIASSCKNCKNSVFKDVDMKSFKFNYPRLPTTSIFHLINFSQVTCVRHFESYFYVECSSIDTTAKVLVSQGNQILNIFSFTASLSKA